MVHVLGLGGGRGAWRPSSLERAEAHVVHAGGERSERRVERERWRRRATRRTRGYGRSVPAAASPAEVRPSTPSKVGERLPRRLNVVVIVVARRGGRRAQLRQVEVDAPGGGRTPPATAMAPTELEARVGVDARAMALPVLAQPATAKGGSLRARGERAGVDG